MDANCHSEPRDISGLRQSEGSHNTKRIQNRSPENAGVGEGSRKIKQTKEIAELSTELSQHLYDFSMPLDHVSSEFASSIGAFFSRF